MSINRYPKLSALSLHDIIGQNVLFFLPPEDQKQLRQMIARSASLKSEVHLIRV